MNGIIEKSGKQVSKTKLFRHLYYSSKHTCIEFLITSTAYLYSCSLKKLKIIININLHIKNEEAVKLSFFLLALYSIDINIYYYQIRLYVCILCRLTKAFEHQYCIYVVTFCPPLARCYLKQNLEVLLDGMFP
jgi:hypothetical protein